METEKGSHDFEAARDAYHASDAKGEVLARYGFNLALRCHPHPCAISETRTTHVAIPEDFELRVPRELMERGVLSSTQIETITLAALRTADVKAPASTAVVLSNYAGTNLQLSSF